MASDSSMKLIECYSIWKSMWPKVNISELADHFGVSEQSIYKWVKKPITINGVKYDNFKAANDAERKELRESYEREINEQIAEGYKLADVWANEIMKRAIIDAKSDTKKITLDEIKIAISIMEKTKDRINGVSELENNSKTPTIVNFTIDRE